MQKQNLPAIAVLLGIWLIAFLYVSPLKNFPLNDDWSYSYTVQQLSENGQYVLTNWIAGPQVTQTFWGYLFCSLFGFSFIALRISTLVIGFIGLVFCYLLLNELTKKRLVSLVATLLLGLNPLYFSLSATFMTDIHFFAWFITSLYFFVIYHKTNQNKYWILATVLSIGAILTRQFGIVAPASMVVYQFLYSRKLFNANLIKYVIATFIVLGFYLYYSHWLELRGQLPENYRKISEILDIDASGIYYRILGRTGYIFLEVGLWLLPVTIPMLISERKNILKHYKPILLVSIILTWVISRKIEDLPSSNIFNINYIGALTTYDTFILKLIPEYLTNAGIKILFQSLCSIGGLVLILLFSLNSVRFFNFAFPSKSEIKDNDSIGIYLGYTITIVYILVLMTNWTYFDRYIIPLLLAFILIISNNLTFNKLSLTCALFGILILGFISLTQTKYYLNWNEARWNLANQCIQNGNPASLIDGGHEFNGFNGTYINRDGKWSTEDKVYFITFQPLEGFTAVDSLPIEPVIGYPKSNMYLLKKNEPKP